MAKTSQLPEAGPLTGDEIVALVQDGESRQSADAARSLAAVKVQDEQPGSVVFRTSDGQMIKDFSAIRETVAGVVVSAVDDGDDRLLWTDQYGRILFDYSPADMEKNRPSTTGATLIWSGAPTSTGFRVAADIEGEGPGLCQLIVSSDADFKKREFIGQPTLAFETARTDTNNFRSIKLEASGLRPDTLYHYRIDVDGRQGTVQSIRTLPVAGDFTFVFGSCNSPASFSTWPSWAAMAALDPAFLLHLGDMVYTSPKVDDVRVQREQLSRWPRSVIPEVASLVAAIPVIAMADNHDIAGNAGYRDAYPGTTYQQVVANSLQAFSETTPHFDFARDAEGPIGMAFAFGCVDAEFIALDCVTFRADGIVIGERQMAWLKGKLIAAAGKSHVFIVSSENWTTELIGWKDNSPAEQTEICNFIRDTSTPGGTPVPTILTGDMHYCAVDDGTHTDYSTGGGADVLQIMSSGLAQFRVFSNADNFFSWNGAPSHTYLGDVGAAVSEFVAVTVHAAGGWTATIYGQPYDGVTPTVLATYSTADLA